MQVFDQADAGCDDIFRDSDLSGDALIAGLGVVALMGDRADDVNATLTDQLGGTRFREDGAQVMRHAVVLDDSAIAIGTAAQAGAIAVGWKLGAVDTSEGDTIGELS
ncbi:hypothetical protein D9M72_617820 [compost metagenome]